MQPIPLSFAIADNERTVAGTPRITLKNRFLEQNPILTDRPVAAIVRPALEKFNEVGVGPIRSTFSAPGLFDEKLFTVSDTFLYTVDTLNVSALITELSTTPLGDISWAPVADIGSTPAHLFFAEGGVLWVYADNGEATGQLQFTGAATAGDVVRIDGVYYSYTAGSVDAGTPDGTSGNPWLVNSAGTFTDQIEALYNAINDEGTPGTDYSTALTQHPTVRATAYASADLFVAAKTAGSGGNSIVTTETGANMSWGAGTLVNGGQPNVRQVGMPNDVGAISVATINSFVIVVPVQDQELETVGRFYWINPGETYVDPLDFANAERSADEIHQVKVYGNMFWLLGQITTEPWVTTGAAGAPMERFQSILFDRGSWAGTAVQVKDSLIVVDEDGGVFQIKGGSQQRISRPDIEERIRRAIQAQAQESL